MAQGDYAFDRNDFALLLIRKAYPERTDGESAVIRAFLHRAPERVRSIVFGKRVGQGEPPDPTHLPAIQRQTTLNTQKRIDILAFRGAQPIIIEVKQRVTPAALGQILTYRHHFVEENPDAPEPDLWIVGRESDADTLAAISATASPSSSTPTRTLPEMQQAAVYDLMVATPHEPADEHFTAASFTCTGGVRHGARDGAARDARRRGAVRDRRPHEAARRRAATKGLQA
jgi:hypothetical protein